MSLRETLIVILVAAIGLAGTAWFLATHERVTESTWTGFQGEARRNPWLAAQHFLNRVATPAEELRSLPELRRLPPNATLIVPQAHQTISAGLLEALVSWVREGGYLIVEAEHPKQSDPLLEAFSVQRSAVNPSDRVRMIEGKNDGHAYQIKLPNAAAPAALNLKRTVSLQSSDAWFRSETGNGSSLLALRFGDGMVTAVSDLDFLTNGAIGTLDHARFLWDLVRLSEFAKSVEQADVPGTKTVESGQTVLFFNRPDKLSLPDWLRKNAWAPLVGGAIALVLWLWRIIPRFGPIAPDAARARRSLLDHLRASGRFLWSNGHATRLLESSREACLREVGRSLPYFRSATPQARLSHLVQVLGIKEEHARYLVQPQRGGSMLQFLHTVRAYQRIYSRLTARQPRPSARPD